MKKITWISATILFAIIMLTFVTDTDRYMQSFLDGISAWAYNVLPALFPFMVLTALYTKTIQKRNKSVTKVLFGVNCDSIYVTSLLCGYPVGAKAISDTNADTNTCYLMSSFCSSASPIFIFATVGLRLINDIRASTILIISHILSTLINGLLHKKNTAINNVIVPNDTKSSFSTIVTNSTLSVLSVGGLIALFYMLIDITKTLLPETICNSLTFHYLIGLVEMTSGIIAICNNCNLITSIVLCSSILSFGGLCVMLQCFAFLSAKGCNFGKLLWQKITQSAISTILSYLLCLVIL